MLYDVISYNDVTSGEVCSHELGRNVRFIGVQILKNFSV